MMYVYKYIRIYMHTQAKIHVITSPSLALFLSGFLRAAYLICKGFSTQHGSMHNGIAWKLGPGICAAIQVALLWRYHFTSDRGPNSCTNVQIERNVPQRMERQPGIPQQRDEEPLIPYPHRPLNLSLEMPLQAGVLFHGFFAVISVIRELDTTLFGYLVD